MARVAFFDLDKTVISIHSGRSWIRSEYRQGHMSLLDVSKALFGLGKYTLGMSSVETMIRAAIRDHVGVREQDIIERTQAFYKRDVRSTVRPGAHRVLDEHREQGHLCVLLTASTNYLADLVGPALRFHDVICTRLEVDNEGIFTGQPVEPLCFGTGKVAAAQAWSNQTGVGLHDAFFYTDSYTDLPMLEAVGYPVLVHPDVRLRKLGERRSWPIQYWDN